MPFQAFGGLAVLGQESPPLPWGCPPSHAQTPLQHLPTQNSNGSTFAGVLSVRSPAQGAYSFMGSSVLSPSLSFRHTGEKPRQRGRGTSPTSHRRRDADVSGGQAAKARNNPRAWPRRDEGEAWELSPRASSTSRGGRPSPALAPAPWWPRPLCRRCIHSLPSPPTGHRLLGIQHTRAGVDLSSGPVSPPNVHCAPMPPPLQPPCLSGASRNQQGHPEAPSQGRDGGDVLNAL